MPDDPFGPDEPAAGPQATQEFQPEWDEEEAETLPRRTITAARTRPLPPRGPNRPQPRGTRRPPPPRSRPTAPPARRAAAAAGACWPCSRSP